MLIPRKINHRKVRIRPTSFRGGAMRVNRLDFGDYGLKSVDSGFLTSRQIEAGRRAMTRYIRRGGKIWVRVFPHIPKTKKPLEVGMGGGKGALDHFATIVKPGAVIYELTGVDAKTAHEALRLAGRKLPVRSIIISTE